MSMKKWASFYLWGMLSVQKNVPNVLYIFISFTCFYSFTVIKCLKSKVINMSGLYTSCLRLNRNTTLSGWRVSPQQVTVGVLALNSHFPHNMWALPTTNTAFGTNCLWRHTSLLLLNCPPHCNFSEAHLFWLRFCVVDVIERDQSAALHKLLLDDW